MSSVGQYQLRYALAAVAAAAPSRCGAVETGTTSRITDWVPHDSKTGEFHRGQSVFRDFISKKPGSQFPPEKGRYHLYVSYACPWAHRTLITRKLKGLEDIIGYTVVHWHMQAKGAVNSPPAGFTEETALTKSEIKIGWRFVTEDERLPGEGVTPDPNHKDVTHLRDLYLKVNPDYAGRFTVPILWDKKTGCIVNNESSEIIRMFYYEFDEFLPEKYRKFDLLPEALRKEIEETNVWTYDDINNGVYKAGFATTQEAYEKNVKQLFSSLDRVEAHLASSPGPYYFGSAITEADIRLYTTIARFDACYVQHFKTNLRDIRSGYPAIHRWLRNLYWDVPAFHDTTQFEHIKKHYTKSHTQINPFGITPLGPTPDILPKGTEVAAVTGL